MVLRRGSSKCLWGLDPPQIRSLPRMCGLEIGESNFPRGSVPALALSFPSCSQQKVSMTFSISACGSRLLELPGPAAPIRFLSFHLPDHTRILTGPLESSCQPPMVGSRARRPFPTLLTSFLLRRFLSFPLPVQSPPLPG